MHVWQSHLGEDVAFDPLYHTNQRHEIMSFLRDPPGTVLDIGCGGGMTGQLIKQKFPGTPVIGIEIDANAAEHWGPDVERGVYQFSPTLARFFAGAQANGLLRADVDPAVPAALLYLTLSGLLQVDAHRERVTGATLRDASYRRALVARLIDVVLHGALAR